jgi:hypothetical protein
MNATMNRMRHFALVGALAAALTTSDASPVAAQTTFWACRVPAVGVLYMIADAAANCLDGTHVKFSWTDGGAPGANTVNSAAIIDATLATGDHGVGSVNSAAIVDATIATADIANAAVTTAKLAAPAAAVQANSVGNTNITAVLASMGSVTIVAPTAGRVLVYAVGNGYVSNTDTLVEFGIGTSATTMTGTPSYGGFLNSAASTSFYFPVAAMETYNVSAGSQTYHLVMRRWGGTGTAQIFDARIRAIFLGT